MIISKFHSSITSCSCSQEENAENLGHFVLCQVAKLFVLLRRCLVHLSFVQFVACIRLLGGSFASDLTITIGDIASLQSDGTPRANFTFLHLELQQPL
jgi:hypothetical protein